MVFLRTGMSIGATLMYLGVPKAGKKKGIPHFNL